MILRKIWIFILLGCGLSFCEERKQSWHLEGIGNVMYTHYYYEEAVLQGILVATEEGVIAFLDHNTGKIKWREFPMVGKKIYKLIAKGRCTHIIFLNN